MIHIAKISQSKKIIALSLVAFGIILLAIGIYTALSNRQADALSGNEFNPGRIIDDSVFYNGNSMNASQIQAFLNSKVPACDTQGTGPSGYGTTRAQYAASRGWHGPPYTCLRDFSQNTPQMEAASGLCSAISAGSRSAAQIIDAVAKACGINPQVLIVLLEKEQSLITDIWPLQIQYRNATGFACPDTAPCDPAFNGFFYQVYHAARQFKVYQAYPNNYNYVAGRSNRVYWQTNLGNYINPSGNANDPARITPGYSSCGYQNVQIQNQATAALYIYTPYQPNQAALANLRGTGDGCSAYGNRNFWRLFSDWFGRTIDSDLIRTVEDGKVYLRGDGNTYYYITSAEQLKNIGYGLKVNHMLDASRSYLDSMHYAGDLPSIVRFGGENEAYLLDSGNRYYLTYAIYQAFGSPPIGTLSASFFNRLYDAPSLSTVVRTYGDENLYFLESGKRRHIGGPAIYSSDGYNKIPVTSLSAHTISNIPKGAPILSAGSLTKTSDSNEYGIVKSDKQTQQPISQTAAKSLSLPYYSDASLYLNLLTQTGIEAGLFAKDESNNLYLIDGSSKYNLSASQLRSINKTAANFSVVDRAFLSNLTTRITNSPGLLVRIVNTSSVYLAKDGELYRIESLRDFNESGFSFNDVIDITQNTFDNQLSYRGKSYLIPGTLFRKGSDATVYVLGRDGNAYTIPSIGLFNDYGLRFSNVLSINEGTFQSIQKNGPLSNYFSAPDGSLWLASNGLRHWIPQALSAQYRTSISNYTPLDASLNINNLLIGQNVGRFIKLGDSQNVYYVAGATKRLVFSPATFYANGGTSWSEVTSVSQSVFDSLSNGATLY